MNLSADKSDEEKDQWLSNLLGDIRVAGSDGFRLLPDIFITCRNCILSCFLLDSDTLYSDPCKDESRLQCEC